MAGVWDICMHVSHTCLNFGNQPVCETWFLLFHIPSAGMRGISVSPRNQIHNLIFVNFINLNHYCISLVFLKIFILLLISMIKYKKISRPRKERHFKYYVSQVESMRVMWGRFESNTCIFQIMQVEYSRVLEYSNHANNANSVSNYLHYLHDFIWVMQVITCIIHNICYIQIFEYFEMNNNAKQVMLSGFKSNTTAMQVFESIRGRPILTRPR